MLIAGLCDLGQAITHMVHCICDLLALVAFDLALGVGALSGMWGIPAVVAVATVGVVTVGVVGGGAGGGRGSVAACSAPADSACAPAAAGAPVVIPVVND